MRNVAILDTRANLAHSLKRTRTPLGTTLLMTQTVIVSKVGILSPTSPSANSKVTILIIVFMYGQKQMNDNISEKFLANDKILESLAMQLEGFNSGIKHQLVSIN